MLIPFLALSTLGPATSALLKDGEHCVYSALYHLYGIQPEADYRTPRKDIMDCVTAQVTPLPSRMIYGYAQQGRYVSALYLFCMQSQVWCRALCQKHTVSSSYSNLPSVWMS